MKAVQINEYGGSEVFQIVDVPTPSPKKDQVLVEVHATSVNPFDWKVREGMVKDSMPLNFPVTLGGDYSGTVKELGEGVTKFKVGDEVYGSALIFGGGIGSLAEFTAANLTSTALKPKSISLEEAAALPLVGASAVQALEEHIGLQKGQKILIHGGAGGIGSIAVQIAKHKGAYIATTVSTNDVDFAKKLGADVIVDYKSEKFEEKIKDYDAVFDTVGGENTNRSFQVLKTGGILVSMLGIPKPELAKEKNIEIIGQNTKTNAKHLVRLAALVDEGAVKVQIDKVFTLDQVKEAFDHQQKSSPRGKVVIRIK